MPSEAALWGIERRALARYGAIYRIENRVAPGMPDVVYCIAGFTGFIENKEESRWPRPTHPLIISTLTLDQVLWHESWVRAGGTVHLMLQLGRDYLLFAPPATRAIFERRVLGRDIESVASVLGRRAFPTTAVLRCLRGQDSPSARPASSAWLRGAA